MLTYEMRKNMLSLNAMLRNVISHVLAESSNKVLTYMLKPTSLARSLRNQRLSNHLPNPVNEIFEIPEKYFDYFLTLVLKIEIVFWHLEIETCFLSLAS
uniref:Ovule protein n=1 Tax=Strongyloides venezuelensis TaxID=75913 RepID=A0A0K0G5H2_STRVS